jgi:hypothetical protein
VIGLDGCDETRLQFRVKRQYSRFHFSLFTIRFSLLASHFSPVATRYQYILYCNIHTKHKTVELLFKRVSEFLPSFRADKALGGPLKIPFIKHDFGSCDYYPKHGDDTLDAT